MDDKLREFLLSSGANLSPSIEVAPILSMGGGKGIVANARIAKGSFIAVIPECLIVTPKYARCELKLTPNVLPIEALALFLLKHRHRNSHWSHWIDNLPEKYDNFLELHVKDVEELLPLRRYKEKVIDEIQRWQEMYNRLSVQFDTVIGSFTQTQFLWAYNTIMSRGFAFDDEVWALMPWVDFFNYANTPNATMYFSHGHYNFVTTKRIEVGEQIFLQYGHYTDFELALWYGFGLCGEIHQENCGYCFSPLANPNGDYPNSCKWIEELSVVAGLVCNVHVTSAFNKLGSCRIFRNGATPGMCLLAHLLSKQQANGMSVTDVLRRIVSGELETISQFELKKGNSLATFIVHDSVDLLRTFLNLPHETLLNIVNAGLLHASPIL